MTEYDFDTAYQVLMSAVPYSQSSGSAMLRNFGAGAQLMAAHLRSGGTTANSGAGDAGVAAQEQAERHAQWFDQVATNASEAANKLDALAATGNQHQATAETIKASYDQAVAADSQPGASGGQDVNVIHHLQSGAQVMNSSIEDWGSAYAGFKAPAPPPVPAAGGSHGAASGAPSSSSSYDGGTTAPGGQFHAPSVGPAHVVAGLTTGGLVAGGIKTVAHPGPGSPGSVEVGPDGGDFAGWYRDPRTGYYVDPATGREFDPVTSRWIDPVTGLPFGDVTQYATGLQGIGPASTTGGLLADTTATAGTSAAGLSGAGGGFAGAGGGFAGLFTDGGNTAAVTGAYGGMLPPSLTNGSAAAGSLWQQAGRSLAVRQQVATSLLAREQAARAGRPYMPPTQAGLGASAGGGGRNRPGYLTADEEEAGLFSSRGSALRGARAGGAVAEEEAEGAVANSRRAYLPPSQAGAGKDAKKRASDRPDWLIEDDVFNPDPAPSGVLGE